MRTEDEVRKKMSDLKSRHLQRLVRKRLKRRPCNCQFNREHSFQRSKDTVAVRLCTLGFDRPDWDVDICEKTEQAQNCPAFLPRHTRSDVEEEFESYMSDIDALRHHYRDILVLRWILGHTDTEYTWWQRLKTSWVAWRAPKALLPSLDDV